ncbi:hypothetical protein [Ancylobacter polymorphus]|uniref:DUF4145 domain-containing protein n=1 Tax=Ancylobacter polymorphus TaxID=223390 RepID=A0ABU0B6H2_9HYPH|nr:hypothetical protein [Ancylobacter polymorphus]MDQ0301422.1 hypothetical protein [Ancylobacter polymorphus]
MYFEKLVTNHKIDMKRLKAAFFAEDDIGAVIRCHYEAERALIHALDKLTSGRATKDKKKNKYFADSLNILFILGVADQIIKPMEILNNVRNGFAHKGHETIDDKAITELQAAVATFTDTPLETFIIKFEGGKTFEESYDKLSKRQKFVVCATIATGMLAASPDAYKQASDKLTTPNT